MSEFRSLGEWARALVRAHNGVIDPRLVRAPTGLGESGESEGGFLIPAPLADKLLTTVYEERPSVLPFLTKWKFPDNANNMSVGGVDETNRGDGYRWGGVVVDFVDEGASQNPSLPTWKATDFSANKIRGLIVLSNELLADAANLDQMIEKAFADEAAYRLEQMVLTSLGTGAGKPMSILNSAALIKVAKQSGQTSGTIVEQNLYDMWKAMPSASRRRAVWVSSESASAQLMSAGYVTLYAPSGATNAHDGPRVFGRPLLEIDSLPIVGTPGDLMLIDPQWYGLASKPMTTAFSADVYFTSDQAAFRLVWRVDGRPHVSTPITASDGAQRSAFVALATR